MSNPADPTDPQSLNRYAYVKNNPINYVDPSGRAFTPFHMLTEFPGALLGWALRSGPDPLTVVYNHYVVDRDLNDLSESGLRVHANAWADPVSGIHVSRDEALRAAWGSFKDNLGNGNTVSTANHTFYDTLTHWGSKWEGFSFDNPSTYMNGITHLLFNDILLGVLFSPVAIAESLLANIYTAASGWFDSSAAVNYSSSGASSNDFAPIYSDFGGYYYTGDGWFDWF